MVFDPKEITPRRGVVLTADIVSAYVSFNRIPVHAVAELIHTVHTALSRIRNDIPTVKAAAARNVQVTLHEDHIPSPEGGKVYPSRKHRSTPSMRDINITGRTGADSEYEASAKKREAVGLWLRECREKIGLTQRELAQLIGTVYFTYISQVELGQSRIIPERWKTWAEALHVDPNLFAMKMLEAYNPIAHRMIFSDDQNRESRASTIHPSRTLAGE